jgi:mannose-1-phosphate guanylyltransferase
MMVVLPADHAIADSMALCASLQQAAAVAQDHDTLMTLGVQPTYPATGFGYIRVGEPFPTSAPPGAHRVAQFTEKPSAEVAERFVASGEYLWNCGIFVWRAATIVEELRLHLPELWQRLQTYLAALQAGASPDVLSQHYAQLPAISIDYGVLEKSSRVGVLPVTFAWNDLGSWQTLTELLPPDSAGNVIIGHHIGRDASGLVVYSPETLVATIGVTDLIIVCADNALLICPKERDQEVRDLVQMLQQRGQTEYL